MGLLRPTGPEAPEVYWRRRVVVLAAAVVVIVLAVLGVRALINSPAAADPPAEPKDDSTTSAAVASGTQACAPGSLEVSLAADATSYPAGALPVFTARMTNTGDTPCVLEAGDGARQIVITSGSDRIWASTDCATGAESLQLLLAAAQVDERTTQWNRSRSDEACSTGPPEPRPGTYQAVLTISGVGSEPVVFQLD